jgi:hypothetical protein
MTAKTRAKAGALGGVGIREEIDTIQAGPTAGARRPAVDARRANSVNEHTIPPGVTFPDGFPQRLGVKHGVITIRDSPGRRYPAIDARAYSRATETGMGLAPDGPVE